MIKEILERNPDGLKQLLEILINTDAISEDDNTGTYQININAELYLRSLSGFSKSPIHGSGIIEIPYGYSYYDYLHSILCDLKELGVIKLFTKEPHASSNDTNIVLGEIRAYMDFDEIPWKEMDCYKENGGIYIMEYSKSKLILFYKILFKETEYLCSKNTLNFIYKYMININSESLIDWLRIDYKFKFSDIELLLFSIALSTRRNLAKLFFYLGKGLGKEIGKEYRNKLREILELDGRIVMDNSKHKYKESFEGFYFTENKNSRDLSSIKTSNIEYDFERSILKVGTTILPSFSESIKQKHLLEYLLENSSRHVTSTELKENSIALKITLDDIKKRLKQSGLSVIEQKKLFHYFESDNVGYCRILV